MNAFKCLLIKNMSGEEIKKMLLNIVCSKKTYLILDRSPLRDLKFRNFNYPKK